MSTLDILHYERPVEDPLNAVTKNTNNYAFWLQFLLYIHEVFTQVISKLVQTYYIYTSILKKSAVLSSFT